MEIKIAETHEEKEAVYALRYACYIEELGWKYDKADSQHKILTDEMDDSAVIYYAEDKGKVVATYCVHFGAQVEITQSWRAKYDLDLFDVFPDSAFSFSSRFIVAPEYRGSIVSLRILMRGYSDGWNHGTKVSFCICRPRLIDLYERLGFIRYKDNIFEPAQGYMVPMVMFNEDADHYKSVQSPFLKLCQSKEPDSSASRWFDVHFPYARATTAKQVLSADDFMKQWADALNTRAVTLLQGFTEEEVQKLLMAGTILQCRSGDKLLREGEAGHEMFLIIEGSVRIFVQKDEDSELQIAVLSAGETFGEMALVTKNKRNATVQAVSDLKVLVITDEFLQSAKRALPEIAIKLLYNLTVVLSEKLNETNSRLLVAQKETSILARKLAEGSGARSG